MVKSRRDWISDSSEFKATRSEQEEMERRDTRRISDPRGASFRMGDNDIALPSCRSAASATAHTPGNLGTMSLVVTASVLRDPLAGESSSTRKEGDDRPILHTEMRLDGCLKPDGTLSHLKSVNLFIDDEDGNLEHTDGSPQRFVNLLLSEDSRKQNSGRSVRTLQDLVIEERRPSCTEDEEGTRGDNQVLRRRAKYIAEQPFNVHKYQTRMLGDQPPGLIAALTEQRPFLNPPPVRKPQGLAAVLSFESLNSSETSAQVEGESGVDANSKPCNHVFEPTTCDSRVSETEDQTRKTSQLERDSRFEERMETLETQDQATNTSQIERDSRVEERRETTYGSNYSNSRSSDNSRSRSTDSCSQRRYRNESRISENPLFKILQSSPQEKGSLLVGSSSKRLSREGSGVSNQRPSDGSRERSHKSKERSRHHRRSSHSLPHEYSTCTGTSYFTGSTSRDRCTGHNRHESADRRRRQSHSQILDGVNEDTEMKYGVSVPPPPPLDMDKSSEMGANKREKSYHRHRKAETTPLDSGGSVSFGTSEGSRGYGSLSYTSYPENLQRASSMEPTSSSRPHGLSDLETGKSENSGQKMASITKLLSGMNSITQLLNNLPQQPWNELNSRDPLGENENLRQDLQYEMDRFRRSVPGNNRTSSERGERKSLSPQSEFRRNTWRNSSGKLLGNIPDGQDRMNLDSINRPRQNFGNMDNQPSEVQTYDPNEQASHLDPNNKRNSIFDMHSDGVNQSGMLSTWPWTKNQLQLNQQGNRLSQDNMQGVKLNHQYDGSQVDSKNPGASLAFTGRPSQPNIQGDELQQFPPGPSDNRPPHVLNSRPYQLTVQDDGFRKLGSMNRYSFDNQPSRSFNSGQAQIGMHDRDVHQVNNANIRPSQFLTSRPPQQFDNLNPQPSQLLNRPSHNDTQSDDQVDPMNARPLQLLRPLMNMQTGDMRQFDNTNSRQSQLLNSRLSQSMQDGDQQHFDLMNNRQSQLLNSRPSEVMQDGNIQVDPMNTRQSQLLNSRPLQIMQDGDQQHFDLMNSRQDLQQFDPVNSRQFQILNSRPSQIMQDGDRQQFDLMNNRQPQLLNSRPSQTMQDGNLQQFDPVNSRQSQILNSRPPQIVQVGDLQQLDPVKSRQPQILNNRPSQIMQDSDLQSFDPTNSRQSQILNSRASQMGNDTMIPRQSQLLNTRPSQMGTRDGNLDEFNAVNSRPSQFMEGWPSQVEFNYRQSNAGLTNRLSQVDTMISRPSQHISKRPFQSLNRRPSEPQGLMDVSSRKISQSMVVCDNCFDPSHDVLDCPFQTCFNCQKPGHYARDCKQARAVQGRGPTFDGVDQSNLMPNDDVAQQWDEEAMEIGNSAQIGDTPQGYQPLKAMKGRQSRIAHPFSYTRQENGDGGSRPSQMFQDGETDDLLQQMGLLKAQVLRRTVSSMLEELHELETRSRQSSMLYERKSISEQSGGVPRNSQVIGNMPQNFNNDMGNASRQSRVYSEVNNDARLVDEMPQQSRQTSMAYEPQQPATTRNSQLLNDLCVLSNLPGSRDDQNTRASRTSEWLISIPTHHDMIEASDNHQNVETIQKLPVVMYEPPY